MEKKKMSRAATAASILGFGILFLFAATAAFAQEEKSVTARPDAITWKMHSGFSPNQFYTRAWKAFAHEVLKRTDGKMDITVYPSSVLGFRMNRVLTSLRDNIVPIAEISSSINEGLMPELKEVSVFYLFDTPEQEALAYAAVRADMEKMILDKYNVRILATCIGAPTEMFLKKEVNTLDDAKGLKIRTAGAAMANQAKLLGMVPATISSKEVGMALERGMVDGMYTSIQGFNDDKFYQYLNVANIVHQSRVKMFVGVNADAFNKLPGEIQTQMLAAAQWLEQEGYNTIRDDEAKAASENLLANGVKLHTPPAEVLTAMKKVGRKILEENAEKAGPAARERMARMLSAAGID